MSKNTNISELINYLSYDGTGNIVFTTVSAATTNTDKFLVSDSGVLKFRTAAQLLSDIGAQASGSYQAALSGTGFVKISGSTISYDNSTYLTTSSASSTYLPLVGGTLTGALGGTTGSFSSFITAQSTGGSGLRIYGSSGTNQWDIYLNSTNLRFSDNTGTGSLVFDRPISGTTATFSGAITSKDVYITNSANADVLEIFQSPSVLNSFIDYPSGRSLILRNKGTAGGLTLASTGAATFNSSVALSAIFNSTSNTPYIRFDESSNAKFFIGQRGSVSGSGGTGYDFYSVASNDIRFFTGGSSTTALCIDTSRNVGIGTTSPGATLDIGSGKNLSGTDPISVYTDVRVASAVTGGLIGYNLRMVALAGSYTVANMYGIKTNTAVVQSGVTVTNSYGIYIGRTDDPTSGGVVTNKYALVTEINAGNVGIGTTGPVAKLHVEGSTAIGTTGTEDILILGRAIGAGASFQQAASLKLGRYQNAGGSFESYTRLDFALRDNSAASNYNTNTTVMTLTNAGSVGIGSINPLTFVEVRKGGTSTTPTNLFGGNPTISVISGEPGIAFSSNIVAATGAVSASQTALAGVGFTYINSTNPTEFNIGIYGTPTVSSNVTFWNQTERMRIASNGAITMLTPTNGQTLSIFGKNNNWCEEVIGSSTTGQSYGLLVTAGTNSADYSFYVQNQAGTSPSFRIRGDSLVAFPKINDFTTGNSPNTWINPASSYGIYINTSSIRYKRDVVNYDKGLSIVDQLRPVYYKGTSEVDGDKQFAGFIAEEVHDLGLTEFVNYLDDGRPNSLSYPNMLALAVKAIQELKTQNDLLKDRLDKNNII